MLKIKTIIKNIEASIAIEGAILIPFFVLVFAGVYELSSYIDAKEKVNRITNQSVNVLMGVPTSPGIAGTVSVLNTAVPVIASPFGIKMEYAFCNAGSSVVSGTLPTPAPAGGFTCGYGDPGSSSNAVNTSVDCSSCQAAHQCVVVKAGCVYHPLINILGLFGDGVTVTSNVVMMDVRSKFSGVGWD